MIQAMGHTTGKASAARRQPAIDFCLRLDAQYPNKLLLGGVYGSTARRADTQGKISNWVTHDYCQGLTDTFFFAKLPADYEVLVPALYNAWEADEMIDLADRLAVDFWVLMAGEGITPRDYQEVAIIPV